MLRTCVADISASSAPPLQPIPHMLAAYQAAWGDAPLQPLAKQTVQKLHNADFAVKNPSRRTTGERFEREGCWRVASTVDAPFT